MEIKQITEEGNVCADNRIIPWSDVAVVGRERQWAAWLPGMFFWPDSFRRYYIKLREGNKYQLNSLFLMIFPQTLQMKFQEKFWSNVKS